MKKKRIIYAVQGMMEYQTIVKVGRNSVKVGFSGGSISNGCAQPARYSTSSLIMQNAIETCEDYRRGRIRRERVITLDEDIVVERNRPASKLEAMLRENVGSGLAEARCLDKKADAFSGAEETAREQIITPCDKPGAEAPARDQAEGVSPADRSEAEETAHGQIIESEAETPATNAEETATEAKEADTMAEDAEKGTLEVVEASCKDVAKQYLQEHYGENPSRLRTRDDVQACAAKYGITFSFV